MNIYDSYDYNFFLNFIFSCFGTIRKEAYSI